MATSATSASSLRQTMANSAQHGGQPVDDLASPVGGAVAIPVAVPSPELARSIDCMCGSDPKTTDSDVDTVGMVSDKQRTYSARVLSGTLWEGLVVRLPWLLLALLGGVFGGIVIERFEGMLESIAAVAFFVPMCTDMGGNMGAQASTILVRGMSVGEVSRSTILRHIRKELLFATAAGLIIGGLATLTIWIWQGAIQNEEYAVRLAFAVGITLFLVCLLGSLTGFVVPFLSHKLRLDAAAVSAPVITTIKDILALLIYFGVASLMLQKYL